MEKSISLKEIVGFLPYRLIGKALHLPGEPTVELSGLGHRLGITFDFWLPQKHGKTGMIAGLGNFKPAVRPLSDLTKEITHNGETFVPMEYFENLNTQIDFVGQIEALIEDIRWLSTTDYLIIEFLFEHHFDLFDWIKEGLAIDINTLNQ